jgi:hypothetical protein
MWLLCLVVVCSSTKFPIKKILQKTDPIFPGRLPADPNLTHTRIEVGVLQLAIVNQLKNKSFPLNVTKLKPARCGFPLYQANPTEF